MAYKDWIQQRADDISAEKYGKDFYSLDEATQMIVHSQACEDYADHYSAILDAKYDAWLDSQAMSQYDDIDI